MSTGSDNSWQPAPDPSPAAPPPADPGWQAAPDSSWQQQAPAWQPAADGSWQPAPHQPVPYQPGPYQPGPDGSWYAAQAKPADNPWYAAQPAAHPTGQAALPYGHPARSLNWRVVRSLWLLVPILGCGCFGGAAFLFIGLRAKRPAWWISGLVYLAVSMLGFVFVDDPEETTTLGDWAVGTLMAAWLVCIVHACLINSAWLRWQAAHVPWYAQPAAGPAAPGYPAGYGGQVPPAATYPAQGGYGYVDAAPPPTAYPAQGGYAEPAYPAQSGYPPAADFGGAPAQWDPSAYGPPVDPTAAPPDPAGGWAPVTFDGGPAGAVDVNAATAIELSTLPYFDPARAEQTVALRNARGGFASVQDFASALNLPPHEFARIRDVVTCALPPQAPPVQGRVLDV
ncbi:ComEA family DNA-binding protein [Polymorphospora rubra]|uniref:Helix-hairpin-helix motif-containing protein n=1 Tax=Polymorphospora rubra TaxID=338584 RepID=A0A810N226_9ACTN|nr:helix-hairpin-helix domain-containing protein [Polymorphospora rubra]BCJ67407.1 hypothetical protein Prubr_44280 [Polymorphospora rubra]